MPMQEKQQLLGEKEETRSRGHRRYARATSCLWLVTPCLLLLAVLSQFGHHIHPDRPCKADSECLHKANSILSRHPIFDGHVDVPIYYRFAVANQVERIDLAKINATVDVDIPRLRKGKVGGMFWSAYVPCQDAGVNYTDPTWRVRDTLEQIDVTKLVINQYPDTFALVDNAAQARKAFKKGRIASFIGIEGAHQLGNSLSALRQYRQLGVRYITLTHTCTNAFADSCGVQGPPPPRVHGGLSLFGRELIQEMNRIGMIVDVSHTSTETANDALTWSEAPVIWSHSNARALHDHPRNVPDQVLARLGNIKKGDTSESRVKAGDALIMVNFVPDFLTANTSNIPLSAVADQIDHIAQIAGKRYIGIGADFDGMGPGGRVHGLEDASKYPYLIAELLKRGWSEKEVAGVASENLLRILDKVDAVQQKLQHRKPINTIYDRRPDLPFHFPEL